MSRFLGYGQAGHGFKVLTHLRPWLQIKMYPMPDDEAAHDALCRLSHILFGCGSKFRDVKCTMLGDSKSQRMEFSKDLVVCWSSIPLVERGVSWAAYLMSFPPKPIR